MTWIETADGVLARRYAELDQTLGLVMGTERCLVVDTGTDDVHGEEFASAIREVTPLPWSVVITHSHWDHFLGTSAFASAPVYAHPRCTAVIATDTADQVSDWAARYEAEGKSDLASRLRAATVVMPDREVTGSVVLDLGDREVTLLHPGLGHTDNDLVVHVPDAGVVFAGDTVEQGAPPSVGRDGYPLEWPRALDVVLGLSPRVVVPGHGEPVDGVFVREQRAEMGAVAALFDGVRSGMLTVEEALEQSPWPADATLPALERGQMA